MCAHATREKLDSAAGGVESWRDGAEYYLACSASHSEETSRRDSHLLVLGSGGIGRGLPTMEARHSIWKTRRMRKHPFAIALSRKAAGASLGVFHRSAGDIRVALIKF